MDHIGLIFIVYSVIERKLLGFKSLKKPTTNQLQPKKPSPQSLPPKPSKNLTM